MDMYEGGVNLKKILIIALCMMVVITSCTPNKTTNITENEYAQEKTEKSVELKITKHPRESIMLGNRGKLKELPVYDENDLNPFQIDFRGYDISQTDVVGEDYISSLKHSSFNTDTKWPEELPKGFEPQKIMEIGKKPGLNVRSLHKEGITGKGVGIAIIDQELLVDHVEYKEQLKFYEEIHTFSSQAQMHGPAVASIAVGKTVGVAPEADLYYIAETHGTFSGGKFNWDFTWLAKSIDRILEVNKILPEENKIRVISISVGWGESQKGYKEVMASVNRARNQGIFVVSSSLHDIYGWNFNGLGREYNDDPDDFNSYKPGYWWEKYYYEGRYKKWEPMLMVPMDARTTASPAGSEDYVYYSEGGWSWSIPYIAGLYALSCQVKPDITPKEFWKTAITTGETIELEKEDKTYKFGKIANPVKLIQKLREKK